MKNVYLLITDLHLDLVKANRLNYFGEILNSMQDIQNIAERYRSKGYSVNAIFLGDVFDGSLSNSSDAMQLIEVMRYFCSGFNRVWSVVGNHELTYAKDNPFWFLVSEIRDKDLRQIGRFIQPQGLCNVISVEDIFTDGDVSFYFNHFGIPHKVPIARGIRIGLFHQNIGSNDICKMWGTFDNAEEASYLHGYTYCYFGHLHLAKGKFYLNEGHTCVGEWLGSIGRTKADEVTVENCKVNIPAIKVDCGKFEGIEDNPIELLAPSQCIDFERLRASQKSRQLIEERRKAIGGSSYMCDTLYKTLEVAFNNTPISFLLDFLNRPWEDVYQSYSQTLKEALIEDEKEEEVNEGESYE